MVLPNCNGYTLATCSLNRRIAKVLVVVPLQYVVSQQEAHHLSTGVAAATTLATGVGMLGAVRWKSELAKGAVVVDRGNHAATTTTLLQPRVDLILSVVTETKNESINELGFGRRAGTTLPPRRRARARLVLRTIASLRQTFGGRIAVVTGSASLIQASCCECPRLHFIDLQLLAGLVAAWRVFLRASFSIPTVVYDAVVAWVLCRIFWLTRAGLHWLTCIGL